MSGPRFVRFYPSDWRSGCIGMTFEQEGFYIRVCAFIYESNRRLPLNDSEAAKLIGANTNAYRKLKNQLVELGKLKHTADGYTVPRAERELASVAYAKREQERPADPVRGRDTRPDTLTDAGGDTPLDTPLEFSEKPFDINAPLKNHNQSLKDGSVCESAREGVTETEDAIKHRAFVISLPAIEMAVLRAGWTKAEIRTFCKAHSLQWAAEIDAGKLSRDVLPQKIVNFLANSIMGQANRDSRPIHRASGRPHDAPRKRSVMDVLRDNPMPEVAA